jgi:hypothetical protein
MQMSLLRRSVAELVGTCFLLAAVVGSGIMGERRAATRPSHCSPTRSPPARRSSL